jgi:glutamate formiminotransferase/formiminotetrahydrofolate cyclodeaminase
VAALAGALGAALASMVANLTHGKEGTEPRDAALARVAEEAQRVKDALVAAVDADADAFKGFMAAMKLPRGTPEEAAARAQKMQEGLQAAVAVPWITAQDSLAAMRLSRAVVDLGNPASLSDGAVGVQLAYAGVRGALWNVLINLKDIRDAGYVAEKRTAAAALLAEARALAEESGAHVEARLAAQIDNARVTAPPKAP